MNKPHFKQSHHDVVLTEFSGSGSTKAKLKNYCKEEFTEILALTQSRANLERSIAQIQTGDNVSPTFKTFITNFLNAAYDLSDRMNPTTFISFWKNDAQDKLAGVELDIAMSSISVFEYSLQYWNINYGKWKDLIDPNDIEGDILKANIGAADAAGAASGGTYGALVGGTTTSGSLTGPA
ncbi:MAG TPA: hypothetical protein VD905_11250 [Flavobacteriales bacterium]|nr:hypothetical protein [Flavobacteriales bacterium]